MSVGARFDRDLTALLEDLYLGPSPHYGSEALTTATHRRQRPSWTFPGRWLPMADIAAAAPVTAPFRWRTIGLAVALIAILVAALAIVAGSQQRVPAPFGPARNGLIVYPTNGDIYALDPVTGRTTPLVTGDSGDLDALFSPDGTKLAFHRLSSGLVSPSEDIMVAGADGSHPIAITTAPVAPDGEWFQWAPDSRSIYEQTADHEIRLLDATRPAEPRVLARGAQLLANTARPPDGKQLLLRRRGPSVDQLVVLDVATGHERVIAQAGIDQLLAARWSTDGRRIAYSGPDSGDPAARRLWIVDADGSNPHQVTAAPGTWEDLDMAWSPDDQYLAFTRYQRTATDPADVWEVRPIGLLDFRAGTVEGIGPTSHDVRQQHPTDHDQYSSPGEGWAFDWSPDGSTLLAVPTEASGHAIVIDPFAKTWKVIDTIFDEQGGVTQEWQRTAP